MTPGWVPEDKPFEAPYSGLTMVRAPTVDQFVSKGLELEHNELNQAGELIINRLLMVVACLLVIVFVMNRRESLLVVNMYPPPIITKYNSYEPLCYISFLSLVQIPYCSAIPLAEVGLITGHQPESIIYQPIVNHK